MMTLPRSFSLLANCGVFLLGKRGKEDLPAEDWGFVLEKPVSEFFDWVGFVLGLKGEEGAVVED